MARKVKIKDLLSNNLSDILEKLNLTQTEAANKIGMDQGYFSKILNGVLKPRIDICLKITKGLGVTLDDVWEG